MEFFKKKTPKEEVNDDHIESGMTALSFQDLEKAKKTYRLTIGCLSVTCLVLAVLVSGKSQETIVMPPDYYEPVIVNGKFSNEAYSAGHAMAIANLMGNVNERNIDFVTDVVLRMLSPHLRAQLFQAFQNEVQLLKNRRARQSFYIEDVMFEPRNNVIWVWGNKRTSAVGSQEISERYTYEFRIEPNHGMPKITHFDSYAGMPKSKDPNLAIEPKPYLTRDLELVKLMSNPEATKIKPTPEATEPKEQPAEEQKQ